MIRLYGSYGSPYVRRVRIIADELGIPCEQVDTNAAEGQAEMRAKNPIWKVPTVELDGQLIFDSHTITEVLLERYDRAGKKIAQLPVDDLEARNAISVIDGALDALINSFYLAKEGVTADNTPYMKKQNERAATAFAWLEQRVHEPFVTSKKRYGLPEIALASAFGWLRFRNVYAIEQHPRLMRCWEEHEKRASFFATQPKG